ncbi:glycosyltransferase family 2 protein, partial [Merdimonas faecis]
MENLIISIIIPVYNTGNYLQECIDSVRQQSYKSLELIFINDGSTDNSSAILDKAAESDPRIKVIEQENSGLSAARNRGMREASGDYIMFLDSDDWLDKG